jgi:WD40 repeat protein
LAHLPGHRESVMAVAFTPDGRRAVTTSMDGTLRVWVVAGVVGRKRVSIQPSARP